MLFRIIKSVAIFVQVATVSVLTKMQSRDLYIHITFNGKFVERPGTTSTQKTASTEHDDTDNSEHARLKTSKTRVNDYGRQSYCTPLAKAKLMEEIRNEALPEHFGASTHARSRHRMVGSLLQDIEFENEKGTTIYIPFQ